MIILLILLRSTVADLLNSASPSSSTAKGGLCSALHDPSRNQTYETVSGFEVKIAFLCVHLIFSLILMILLLLFNFDKVDDEVEFCEEGAFVNSFSPLLTLWKILTRLTMRQEIFFFPCERFQSRRAMPVVPRPCLSATSPSKIYERNDAR